MVRTVARIIRLVFMVLLSVCVAWSNAHVTLDEWITPNETSRLMLLCAKTLLNASIQMYRAYEGQRRDSEIGDLLVGKRPLHVLGRQKILLYASQDNTKMEASSAICWPFLLSACASLFYFLSE